MRNPTAFLDEALGDPANGWSIGTFGAIGEFVRNSDEPTEIDRRQIVTRRGAIRFLPRDDVEIVAYETLISDGETWGNAVAFCLPRQDGNADSGVHRIGPDGEALRPADRSATLFDLGVGIGPVRMCVRTEDSELIALLDRLEGKALLSAEGKDAGALILKLGPNRVMLSPLGRIEVYAAIPPADGKSPTGPHTHLLPKLIASGRTYSANAPIPDRLQPMLMLHPPSPWRDAGGKRKPFDRSIADRFDAIVAAHGLPDDRAVRAAVEGAVKQGDAPQSFRAPSTRRAARRCASRCAGSRRTSARMKQRTGKRSTIRSSSKATTRRPRTARARIE